MTAALSISEENIFIVLRAMILSLIDTEVVRAQTNRVPMPKGSFISMMPTSLVRLLTNETLYDAQGQSQAVKQGTQVTIQLDCYGPQSSEWAVTLMTVLRGMYASEFFTDSGFDIQPLYASDPTQMPLVNGEQQYEKRWMLNAVIQSNPVLTLSQQYPLLIGPVDVINVDATYPP